MHGPLEFVRGIQEELSKEMPQILEVVAERTSIPAPQVDMHALWPALIAERAEDVAIALNAALNKQKIPHNAAQVVLFALRRNLVRHVQPPNDRIAEFIEDVIERASIAQLQAAQVEAQEKNEHHSWVVENLPAMMHSIDGEGKLIAVNDRWLEALGYTREEVIGRRSSEFLTPESARYARDVILPEFFKSRRCDNVLYQFVRKNGSTIDIMLSAIADTNSRGESISMAVLIDVTAQLASERAAQTVALQEDLIRSQREMLRAISTPLVPLGDGILLMPLVGDIDAARAEQIMAVLLEGVVTHAAEVAILDVTGVPSMDSSVAEGLIGATKAVGLLGAHVILTGIGPSAARTLVELGVDLGAMTTKSTLRDGLSFARKRMGRKQ